MKETEMRKTSSPSHRKRKHESRKYSINVRIYQCADNRYYSSSKTSISDSRKQPRHAWPVSSRGLSFIQLRFYYYKLLWQRSRLHVALMMVLAGIVCWRCLNRNCGLLEMWLFNERRLMITGLESSIQVKKFKTTCDSSFQFIKHVLTETSAFRSVVQVQSGGS